MTAHQEQEHRMACRFTVANAMGPLLRAAFPEHHVEAVDPCTVITTDPPRPGRGPGGPRRPVRVGGGDRAGPLPDQPVRPLDVIHGVRSGHTTAADAGHDTRDDSGPMHRGVGGMSIQGRTTVPPGAVQP